MSMGMKKVEFWAEHIHTGIGTVHHIIGIDQVSNKLQEDSLTVTVYHSSDIERYLQGDSLQPARKFRVDYGKIKLADKYRGKIHAVIFVPICPQGEEKNPKYADFVKPEYFRRVEEISIEQINDCVEHFDEFYNKAHDYDNYDDW